MIWSGVEGNEIREWTGGKSSVVERRTGKLYGVKWREMKCIGVEGNGMACSGASGNEKEWSCGKCRGVEESERK